MLCDQYVIPLITNSTMLMFSMNKYLRVFLSHFLLFLESALSVLLLLPQLHPASVEILVPLGLGSHPLSTASYHKPPQADTEVEQVYPVFRLQFPVEPLELFRLSPRRFSSPSPEARFLDSTTSPSFT